MYKLKGLIVDDSEFDSIQVVAMAGSTGGARVLSIILQALPADFGCPVLVSPHTTEGYL